MNNRWKLREKENEAIRSYFHRGGEQLTPSPIKAMEKINDPNMARSYSVVFETPATMPIEICLATHKKEDG
jgi:hypothetical protein